MDDSGTAFDAVERSDTEGPIPETSGADEAPDAAAEDTGAVAEADGAAEDAAATAF